MAAARAEARRKAILSRGTDRLAKLTTSARGEDGGGHLHDDPPLPNISTSSAPSTSSFIGEETDMPTSASRSRGPSSSARKVSGRTTATSTAASSTGANFFEALSNSSTATSPPHNPSAWLPEQHQQFMQALLHASAGAAPGGNASLPGLSSPIGDPTGPIDPSAPPIDNPFAALMGLSGAGMGGTLPPGLRPFPIEEQKPKTTLQKVLPLLHFIAVWCLLAYFLLWAEPKSYAEAGPTVLSDERWNVVGLWKRWAELGRSDVLKRGLTTYRLQIVPFFWAFTTLEIILHSLRIFAGFNAVQPPSLIALALPHLPPPIPSVVVNSLKYMQMGSLFLDDLSGVIVGLGFITYFSGWLVGSS